MDLPPQVLQSIRRHVEKAVAHAESGYRSSQEEEDTVTGELGGALRTKKTQVVPTSNRQSADTWRWSITYSKFRSKARNATESIVGADGILEIRVGNPQRDQRKSALFQAKNTEKRDPNLVEQSVKMSVWREAAFVISYSSNGYLAYSIDDVLQSGGTLAKANNGRPLATWMIDTFIGCKIGHPDLYYDKDERRLYWVPQQSSDQQHRWDERWVWVDFRPKHLIHIDVTPPDWERAHAVKISPNIISLNRLTFTPDDLFGIEGPFTLAQLRKRRAELLHVYHSDKTHHLNKNLKTQLDSRVIEINEAFTKLSEGVVVEKKTPKAQKAKKKQSSAGLEESRTPTVDDFPAKKRPRDHVRVRPKKKTNGRSS